ncbi:MAG: glyoxalase/bleomycin resistance/extradiol dioxygenase family protein [Gammaproteobacteria bacterium]|nr:glyoxalase/bleomycin resistance/extradiol dioxygenase family protein [Gammaproteobacteria bacterium]|tara:strand:- start:5380 stop:5817 length:438 start_codon:yes stop_codon:yes gene_type:complete
MQQTQPMECGIPVTDLDAMLDFYCSVLGCKESRRADIPAQLSNQLAVAPDGYVNVWLETPGGEIIKLMQPPAAPQPHQAGQHLATRGGIGYLTFYCSDLHDTLAAAEAKGATLRSDRTLIDPERPLRLCFFADPEGNIIELVEVG